MLPGVSTMVIMLLGPGPAAMHTCQCNGQHPEICVTHLQICGKDTYGHDMMDLQGSQQFLGEASHSGLNSVMPFLECGRHARLLLYGEC